MEEIIKAYKSLIESFGADKKAVKYYEKQLKNLERK